LEETVGLKYVMYVWHGFDVKNPGGHPPRDLQHRLERIHAAFSQLSVIY